MTSNSKFIGYLVSIESKNLFYQGIIELIDPSKAIIQLKNCFQNGLHLGNKLIEIKTTEIDNIEILADPQNALNLLKPISSEVKEIKQKQDQDISLIQNQSNSNNFNDNDNNNNNDKNNNNKSTKNNSNQQQISPNYNDSLNNNNNNNHHHHHHQKNGNHHNLKRSNSHFYNSNGNHNSDEFCLVNEDSLKDDFDFERNLALFDKNAFYEQVEGHVKPPVGQLQAQTKVLSQTFSVESDQQSQQQTRYHQISLDNLFSSVSLSKQQPQQEQHTNQSQQISHSTSFSTNGYSSNKNYRFDEMILDTGEPINFKQIQLPRVCSNKNYVTDDGFLVPCIDYSLRESIFEQAYKYGFTKQRQIECMGRCCTEMCLQLLGGSIRFLPKNNHQKPAILILANNDSLQGIYALCTARLLSIRTVKVYLLILRSSSQSENEDFKNELNFFKSNYDSTSTVIFNSVNDLSSLKSVDLIINGLESFEEVSSLLPNKSKSQGWFSSLARYLDNCKACILSIDPPSDQKYCVLKSKWCITPVLPMEMANTCGRVYLCDFGFTKQIFQSVNIKYQSPFGAKFVIPLHND